MPQAVESQKAYVNVLSRANTKAVRYERRNGRDVVIVPSATLPDNVIMNGIKYPADEIAKSFMTLNRTPAPYGHPMINGVFVSASDPEGINIGYIGAWNENVRQEGGRVLLDKVIDIEVANQTQNGKDVLEAVKNGAPVDTSTGLFCMLDAANAGEGFEHSARDIYFDHDAILLNEAGAATPAQGVGMMVNHKATDRETGQEIQVINSAIEMAEEDLDYAVAHVVKALDRREKSGMVDRVKQMLIEAFSTTPTEQPQTNESDEEMADDTKFEELKAQMNALIETIPALIANAVKPLIDAQTTMQANIDTANAAELAGYVATIVKANALPEAIAGELTLNAAKALASTCVPGTALNVNGAPIGNVDEYADFDLNAIMDGGK
jgi:hypothetical protein